MNKTNTVRFTTEELEARNRKNPSETDWEAVADLAEDNLDVAVAADPDADVGEVAWWGFGMMEDLLEMAEQGSRTRISIKIEDSVLDYFKREGPGYQTRMNAVLKAYVIAQQRMHRSRGA